MYCFEYAVNYKNYDYVHKAKLYFYVEYGTDTAYKNRCLELLNNPNASLAEFKELAGEKMPDTTTVMNIEFETKRKFYYYSDEFIEKLLKTQPRPGAPKPLERIYKIIDNRAVFLDYLTETTLCFKKDDEYCDWWKRLRTAKLDGFKADSKLTREYSKNIDIQLVQRKLINNIATASVYLKGQAALGKTFVEDISDVLSNINDNTCNLDLSDISIVSEMLCDYGVSKAKKERRLKNRIATEDVPEEVESAAEELEEEAEDKDLIKLIDEALRKS